MHARVRTPDLDESFDVHSPMKSNMEFASTEHAGKSPPFSTLQGWHSDFWENSHQATLRTSLVCPKTPS